MDLSILNNLTPEQREVVTKILKDTLEKNKSEELNELLATDYEQLPVDIDTFMTDGQYMGKYTNFGRNLKYRKWPETLREWFPNPLAPSPYTEIAITGCLTGDTKIPLLNGTNPTIEELYYKHLNNPRNNGKDTIEYLYSFDVNDNTYKPGELVYVFYTGEKQVYKITLDNGEFITCSGEHPFMTINKQWKAIDSGLDTEDLLICFSSNQLKLDSLKDYNHKIVSIEKLGIQRTYDLTVKNYHNFALYAGIVSKNSTRIREDC